ncbi:7-cyano-7-deazaguanine synthase (queuosine biosynthesis) [Aquipseudomonas alcaligenes]|uniref:Qat anti-phage system QueC-like protein QatC n=1 Tax=Aquipseudomonas alcaligenes TaxID=43263 RepID=UPI0009544223|nr:Qat anti-phage system QueC-like protein QatC [Pseudomonas alcaligenes]SIS21680.1 7-cyano-7-deazaguanine synthase (queuosine biosynthesis) [Pseudomonas alcaligenes]
MKFVCGPAGFQVRSVEQAMPVVIYGQAEKGQVSVGGYTRHLLEKAHLEISPQAWDFLSIALSVVAADFTDLRARSADGWTRTLKLHIAVQDPVFWNAQARALEAALGFLTTDVWTFVFHPGGYRPPPQLQALHPREESVALLSGGMDSLIGAIDLVTQGVKPYAVSQVVRGDGKKQSDFAQSLGLSRIGLNHVARSPGSQEPSQRARSIVFLAFGLAVATSLDRYHQGGRVPLYICENGFIAINPPLTVTRLGSLSTRTAHPEYLGRLQQIFDAAGINVQIQNPYALKTKGEMMTGCLNQYLLKQHAVTSTSCGRFQRFGYKHCGRCVPCQVRRASFIRWGELRDSTPYVYEDLSIDNLQYGRFEDVRSVGMAVASVAQDGFDQWLGHSLFSPFITERAGYRRMLVQGLDELANLHAFYGLG